MEIKPSLKTSGYWFSPRPIFYLRVGSGPDIGQSVWSKQFCLRGKNYAHFCMIKKKLK